jgi:hypothetical protein
MYIHVRYRLVRRPEMIPDRLANAIWLVPAQDYDEPTEELQNQQLRQAPRLPLGLLPQ